MADAERTPRLTSRKWRRHLWLVVFAATAACILSFAASSTHRLSRADGCDYAQIAREVTEGRGFSSRQAIYLLHLRFLKDHGLLDAPWPNLHRFPLPSIALAAFFLVLGPTLAAVLAYGTFFHGATAALLFCWGRRMVGLGPALGAVVLFGLNGTTLETGSTGLAEPVAIFFFTLALAAAWRGRARPSRWWPLWSGAALGVAALGRTNIVLALPALVLLGSGGRGGAETAPQRVRRLVSWTSLLVASTVLAMSPWLVRNWRLTGSPTFSLHSYFLVPSGADPAGDKWDISRPWVRDFVSPVDYVRAHPGPVLEKWARHAGRMVTHFPSFGGTWASLLFLVGLVLPAGRALRPLAGAVLFGLVANVAFVSFTDRFIPKYSYHFVPAMLLVATAVAWRGLRALGARRFRPALFVLVVAVLLDPAEIVRTRERLERDEAIIRPSHMDFIRAHTRKDAVVLSDVSAAVTWATGRRTVRTHFEPNAKGKAVLAARRIHEEFVPLDGVYLVFRRESTRPALNRAARDPAFAALFPHRHEFPDGSVYYYRPGPVASGPG